MQTFERCRIWTTDCITNASLLTLTTSSLWSPCLTAPESRPLYHYQSSPSLPHHPHPSATTLVRFRILLYAFKAIHNLATSLSVLITTPFCSLRSSSPHPPPCAPCPPEHHGEVSFRQHYLLRSVFVNCPWVSRKTFTSLRWPQLMHTLIYYLNL